MRLVSHDPRKFVVIDLEATGMTASQDRIIELALVVLQESRSGFELVDSYSTLVKPDLPVPEKIFKLTGIDPSDLDQAPRFVDIAQMIELYTRDATLVAHGAQGDFELLRAHFDLIGQDFRRSYLCTLNLARENDPGLPAYDLKSLCLLYDIELKNHHRALSDALACATLFTRIYGPRRGNFTQDQELQFKLLRRFPQLDPKELAPLSKGASLLFLYKDNRIVSIHPLEEGREEAIKLLLKSEKESFDRISLKNYDHYILAMIDAFKLKKRFRPKYHLVQHQMTSAAESYPQENFSIDFDETSIIFRNNKLQGVQKGESFRPIHETKAIRAGILTYLRNSKNAKVRPFTLKTLKKVKTN